MFGLYRSICNLQILPKRIILSKTTKVFLLVLHVLILDQALKIWVKTNMGYGSEINLLGLSWAKLHFVENNGMAFGISLKGSYGKLALSLFRIVAVVGLAYYIHILAKAKASLGLLMCFGLILAGALGNIIDSAFYGLIFSASHHGSHLATMFPEGGGYAGFLYGKVVDMFYFPLFKGHFPEWFPFWSGESFLFFRPVFNIADVAISTGVISIIVFHRDFFSVEEDNIELEKKEELPSNEATNSNSTENIDSHSESTDTDTEDISIEQQE